MLDWGTMGGSSWSQEDLNMTKLMWTGVVLLFITLEMVKHVFFNKNMYPF